MLQWKFNNFKKDDLMIHTLLSKIDEKFGFEQAGAHCDVPCGVYDPMPAQIAAMTVARMTDTILDLEAHDQKDHGGTRDHHYQNKITRMINEKERSAEHVKHEVRIIWGDFFKAPQFEAHPELQNLCHTIMMTASKCKQNIDQDATRKLVDEINQFAEVFFKIKGISTKRVTYHCKPNLEIVIPEL